MPDLESASLGVCPEMVEPEVSDRLATCSRELDRKFLGFRTKEAGGMEVAGSKKKEKKKKNLGGISRVKFERACREYKEGRVVKPTERIFRLMQLRLACKNGKFRDVKGSAEECNVLVVNGKKVASGDKRISKRSFEGEGEALGKNIRKQVQKFGAEALGKKVKTSAPLIKNSDAHSGQKKRERIVANGVIRKETTEPEKLKNVKKTGYEGIPEAKRRRLGKADVQCGEKVGLIREENVDNQRRSNGVNRDEARNLQRNRQRKQMSGNIETEVVGRKITRVATNGNVSTSKPNIPVNNKGRMRVSSGPLEDIPLQRGRGRFGKESLTMKNRPKPLPMTVKELEGRRTTLKDVKENGLLESHGMDDLEGTNATSDESKISGLDNSSQERGTLVHVNDRTPMGGNGAFTVAQKLVDGLDDQKQEVLIHDKNTATIIPIAEGTISDKNSPASDVTEAETNKDTEAEGNKDFKGLNKEPQISPEAWVMCDECKKWRRILVDIADYLDETKSRWCCRDNLDKDFADCSIPQEKSNAEINAELNISESSNCNDEDNIDGQVDSKAHFKGGYIEVAQQYVWISIERNIFMNRRQKTQTIDEIMVCQCKPPEDGRAGCCGEDCLNYSLNVECVPGTCPCGEVCSNQRFQKRLYPKVKEMRCGKKGYGLFVQENVPEGTFVIEYVGEVIGLQEWQTRAKEYAFRGHKHFYFLKIGHEVIDACVKGNHARFINHSCNPNCKIEKWLVNGEACIGFFATRDLVEGEELTADYQFQLAFGAAAKRCACGSANCRGIISTSRDPENYTDVVDNESEGEEPLPIMVKEGSEDAVKAFDCLKSSSIEKIPEFPEAKTEVSDKVQSESIVKKSRVASGSDGKKNYSKKLKRSKIVSTSEKPKVLSSKGLEMSTNRKLDGVEEVLNEMLDECGGIAKRRDVAKHYLKLLVVTAASGDVNDEASGSTRDLCTRDLSMVLDALLKTKSRSVLANIADKNGFQLLHNMIKQHHSAPDKTPIIRKLLKILHLFAVKRVFTSEHMSSIPSREGVESFEESIFILTRHDDREVQKLARQIKEIWGILPTARSFVGKQSPCGSSLVKANNQTWKKDKFPMNPKASFINTSKVLIKQEDAMSADCGRIVEDGQNTQPIVDEWNSNEQTSIRKGKSKSDLDESRHLLDSEKQCSDNFSKDHLPGDCSAVQEQRVCGSFSPVSVSEERPWFQGQRMNIRNKNERWPPRYPSSQRNTYWNETVSNVTRSGLAPGAHMLDRKSEQHGVQMQFNTVAAANSNPNSTTQLAPFPVGGIPFVPQGSGVGNGSTQEICSPQMPVAYGIPVELFQQLHGLPIRRSGDTGGKNPRELGGMVGATPCRIPCEHFSMPQTTNMIRPFLNSGGLVSLSRFPHDPSLSNPHGRAGPVSVPFSLHSGVRPFRNNHVSHVSDNQMHLQRLVCDSKSESSVLEQENTLEPEPPVPGLSPSHLPESSKSVRYFTPFDSVRERNKTSDLCIQKSNLLHFKDSREIARSKGNNGDLPTQTLQISADNDISRYDSEQAAKACFSQNSCPLDNMQNDCYRSSPSCTERVCLASNEMPSPEAVTSSCITHLSSFGPSSLGGPKHNFDFSSKGDIGFKECRTLNGANSLVQEGEHSKAPKELSDDLKPDTNWSLCHERRMPRSLNAENIQPEPCDNEMVGHVKDFSSQSDKDKNIDKDSNPCGENFTSPMEGIQATAAGKLE